MVHLFSTSLASLERCECEKEVITTPTHPLLIDVEELRELSRFSAGCVALLFYVHGKHLRSCRDGQLT